MQKQLFIISFLFFYYGLIGQNGSSRLSIFFITDKHDLNNQYKSLIDNHLDSIKNINFTNVKIIGHTDSVGNIDYNFNLSLKRAYSVLNYLIEKGYNRDSIKVEYLGENSPDFDNITEGG